MLHMLLMGKGCGLDTFYQLNEIKSLKINGKYNLLMRGSKMKRLAELNFGWITSVYKWLYLFLMYELHYAVPKTPVL